uniref:Uncharacterized protein n=1 Tax=Anopheles arabiensis TaxID=7173 RepID=A0A182IEV3_ANOAR
MVQVQWIPPLPDPETMCSME